MPVREALHKFIVEQVFDVTPTRSVCVPVLSAEKFAEIAKRACPSRRNTAFPAAVTNLGNTVDGQSPQLQEARRLAGSTDSR
jgi:hypothetical protein